MTLTETQMKIVQMWSVINYLLSTRAFGRRAFLRGTVKKGEKVAKF